MQKILRSFVSISTIFVMVFSPFASFSPTVSANGVSEKYGINIDTVTLGPLSITLSGVATSTDYAGTGIQQHVSIRWGDGKVSEKIAQFYPVFSGKGFSGPWGPITHTYDLAGPYTVTAIVHHGNLPGNESGDASQQINVIIPPATLTVIKHVVNNNEGIKVASDFTIIVTGTKVSTSSFQGSELGTTVGLDAGTYSVSEDLVDGYSSTLSTDCSGTIASGQTKTCTITNNDIAQCIPSIPTTEVCDGLDNDCDSSTDEGLGSTTCGVGECQRIVQNCVNGITQVCTPGSSTSEVCDGKDNNCDGMVDNTDAQGNPLTQSTTCGLGACSGDTGYKTCINGEFTADTCNPFAGATPEVCDANQPPIDEDCNGSANEGCACIKGETKSCYEGPQGTEGVGICQAGTQTCDVNGQWGQCDGVVYPTDEVCNGLDDNCNGQIDDGLTASLNSLQDGVCSGSTQTCAGVLGWTDDYTGVANYEATETSCDGLDNNCNGQVDEGVKLTFYQDSDGDNYGNAIVTTQACSASEDYVSDNTDCDDSNSAINPGATEICDGIDNNCDGYTDEGCGCTNGATLPCGQSNVGICVYGIKTCVEGTWGGCVGAINPITEICNNGLDDDCDGYTDAADTNCQQCTPQAASPFEDDFNSYNDGNLNGQGSWVASPGTVTVQGTTVFEGAKAIYAGANAIAYKAGNSLSDGRVVFYLKTGDTTADFYMFLKSDDSSKIHFGLNFTGTRTVDYHNGSGWVNIGTFTADEWFSLEVEWRSSDQTARYRFAEGTWTDWVSTYGYFTTVNIIDLEGTPATQVYVDYIAENPECSTGQSGICSAGTQTCDQSGFWGSCVQNNLPTTEICDNQLDDDCDGYTDAADTDCYTCTPQATTTCSTQLPGICSAGTKTCTTEGIWGTCTQTNSSTTEICDNQLDDDCDGVVNNGCLQPPVCGDSRCNGGETCSSCSQDCGSCGGGGGGGSGIPTLIIVNESVGNINTDNVTITWNTNLAADSRLVYSDFSQNHTYDFGNHPNYGYANSNTGNPTETTIHSMTLNGLLPATTYYLRCISETASDFAASIELTFTTPAVAGAFIQVPPTEIFPPLITEGGGQVAGIATETQEEVTIPQVSPQVSGEEKTSAPEEVAVAAVGLFGGGLFAGENLCLILFISLILLTIWYLVLIMKRKKAGEKVGWTLPVIILLLFIFYYFRCCPACGLFCCYKLLILLIIDAILFIVSLFNKEKKA